MTPTDPRLEMTLELSRRTQEPSAADQARNLAQLRERLGLPVPPMARASGSEHPLVSQPALKLAARDVNRTTSLAKLTAVAGVAAAIGFFAGLSLHQTPSLERQEQAPLSAAAPGVAPPEPAPAALSDDGLLATREHASSDTLAPAPVVRASEPRPARKATRARAHAANETPAPSPEFLEAVRLLRRARNALAKGEGALALGLLGELDARFPRDMLDEERAVTRVLALCASGDDAAAKALATRLLARYPRSIYTARLERSCAAAAPRE
jgi:hypothetical protein